MTRESSRGWRIDDKLAFKAGYMNQYLRADSGEDRVNHMGVSKFKKTL